MFPVKLSQLLPVELQQFSRGSEVGQTLRDRRQRGVSHLTLVVDVAKRQKKNTCLEGCVFIFSYDGSGEIASMEKCTIECRGNHHTCWDLHLELVVNPSLTL